MNCNTCVSKIFEYNVLFPFGYKEHMLRGQALQGVDEYWFRWLVLGLILP